jgi:hypothetical protein
MALYAEDATIDSAAILVLKRELSGILHGKPKLHAHFMAFFDLVRPGALAMEFTTLVMTSRLFVLKPNPTRRGDRANSGRRCSI